MSGKNGRLAERTVPGRFAVRFADHDEDKNRCYRLRYDIFAGELGANLQYGRHLDKDRFDDHCSHVMVIDQQTSQLVATTRLLAAADAVHTGGFYSATEFDISSVLAMPGTFMEVGRTCIHKDYRKGAVLALLWQGIAQIIADRGVNYLIGCASLPLSSGDHYLSSMMKVLRESHFSDEEHRVRPLVPLKVAGDVVPDNLIMPPLLKGYLRQGAVICGEPYWDAEFGVADVFVLLKCDRIAARYVRHFLTGKSA